MAKRIASRPARLFLCHFNSIQPFSTTAASSHKSKYPLYPAVGVLLHANSIPTSDISKIPATGPGGRLLKGDVLSYLGRIQGGYSAAQSKRIQRLAHLDLTGIKVAPKAESRPASPKMTTEPPATTTIALPISLVEVTNVQKRLEDTVGVAMPLSTFLARAFDIANENLPRADAKPSANELFDAVLGVKSLPKRSKGSYIPQITLMGPSKMMAKRKSRGLDIVDILSGRSVRAASPTRRPPPSGLQPHSSGNVFNVTVPTGEAKRARTFLERVKTVLQVEPERLIL